MLPQPATQECSPGDRLRVAISECRFERWRSSYTYQLLQRVTRGPLSSDRTVLGLGLGLSHPPEPNEVADEYLGRNGGDLAPFAGMATAPR